MNRKALEHMYPRLYQMFSAYFHQNFETTTEDYDENKPIVPQITYNYKRDCTDRHIEATIKELEDLINKHYTEDLLDKITYELGMWIKVSYYGYTHNQFLREIVQLLKDEHHPPRKWIN